MTNKYTLKDPYEWHIARSIGHCNDMELSIRYRSGEHTVISASRTIHSPKPHNAQTEIVFAMDRIKENHPELFQDYESLTDSFDKALKKIDTLNDIQLSEILCTTAALALTDHD